MSNISEQADKSQFLETGKRAKSFINSHRQLPAHGNYKVVADVSLQAAIGAGVRIALQLPGHVWALGQHQPAGCCRAPRSGKKASKRGCSTIKLRSRMTVPPAVTSVMGQLVAVGGTIALSRVSLHTAKAAATPLKRTADVVARCSPVIMTALPG
jgi:hypothetical protein